MHNKDTVLALVLLCLVGCAAPWINEDFTYTIRGGIEPGETATWKIFPNSFSAWGTKVPDDTVLTVTVTKLDGADSKTLYDGRGLDEFEQKRLAELKKKYDVR